MNEGPSIIPGTWHSEIPFGARDCQLTCDADCEYGTIHCWNRHRPRRKPGWHDPEECDRKVYDVNPDLAADKAAAWRQERKTS